MTDFYVTARQNIREDNMVIIDTVATTKGFGFYTNVHISECSFQKAGHDQKCVSNQKEIKSLCSNIKLEVTNGACFIQNNGLTFTGILIKKILHF